MKIPSILAVIQAGLLVFPPKGNGFPPRNGRPLPFLIDSRGAGTDIPLRNMVVEGLRVRLQDMPQFDVIGGISKAGTIWAAWLAWVEQRPYATVILDPPRQSGLQRAVEGEVAGKRVLLIDNWVRSGASVVKAIDVVTQAGGVAVGALAIVTDGMAAAGVPLQAIWHIDELLCAADKAGKGRARP
jgi:orotate phosphoribosyltransferase